MLVTLPHGLLDGTDLFDIVEIDELRGKQQNYLADKDLVQNNIGHVPKILEDMIKSFQTKEGLMWKGKVSDAIWKITASDIETILIKIRENTYGPKFYHESECPYCKHITKNLRLDLDSLEIDKLSYKEINESKIKVLPKSNVEVEFKPMYLSDMFSALKIMTKDTKRLITSSIALGLKRLGDKTSITSEDVENISAKDLQYLNEEIEKIKVDGNIDTDIEIVCSNSDCKKEYKIKLNCLEPSFFVPSRESTS